LDTALLNGSDDSVNFTLNEGSSFKVFTADFQNRMFLSGTAFTLNVNFADGSTATGNVTIGSAQTFILTVASSNPGSGASVAVTPNDNSNQGSGLTQFTRTYNNNAAVTLTAPATAGGNNFSNWSGCDSAT
jgi:hypothetical protein